MNLITHDVAHMLCSNFLGRQTPEALNDFNDSARRVLLTQREKAAQELYDTLLAIRKTDDVSQVRGDGTGLSVLDRMRLDGAIKTAGGK